MKAIFIADAHLIDETSPGYAELLDFLEELRLARLEGSKAGGLYADELFILGDFFDFWFARGTRIYPPFEKVLAGLLALKEAGVRIHLAEGNHDFFLADYFSRYLGMEVTPDWAEVKLDGQRILFAHGDVVGSVELSYKLLRGILRSGFFYRLQRLVPLSILFTAARLFSRTSRELGRNQTEELVDKLHTFARQKLTEDFDAVVLGHCHKPLLKHHNLGARQCISATVGGWNCHRSYLFFADGAFSLRYFHFRANCKN